MYHTVVLLGRLGGDVKLSFTPKGEPVAQFSLAVDNSYRDGNGEIAKQTMWVGATIKGRQAEACYKYLAKGDIALVTGRLMSDAETGGPRLWVDKDDKPRASFEVIAHTVRFVYTKGKAEEGGADEGF